MLKSFRAQLPFIIIAILLGFAVHVGWRAWMQQSAAPTSPVTLQLGKLQFNDANGKPFVIKNLQNKTIVLNFWATWCEPCREEMPAFSALAEQYASKNVVFIGLAIDEASAVAAFAKSTPVSYPLLIAENEGMALAEQLGNNKGVLPYTVLIGDDGSVEKTFFGRVNRAVLEPIIKEVLLKSAK